MGGGGAVVVDRSALFLALFFFSFLTRLLHISFNTYPVRKLAYNVTINKQTDWYLKFKFDTTLSICCMSSSSSVLTSGDGKLSSVVVVVVRVVVAGVMRPAVLVRVVVVEVRRPAVRLVAVYAVVRVQV